MCTVPDNQNFFLSTFKTNKQKTNNRQKTIKRLWTSHHDDDDSSPKGDLNTTNDK